MDLESEKRDPRTIAKEHEGDRLRGVVEEHFVKAFTFPLTA